MKKLTSHFISSRHVTFIGSETLYSSALFLQLEYQPKHPSPSFRCGLSNYIVSRQRNHPQLIQDNRKMESIVKKYQQRFRKLKEEMARWEDLQSRLVSQFINASSIAQRLQLIQDRNNYGVLKSVESIQDAVLDRQMESLNNIFLSMSKTMGDFEVVVSTMEKIVRDSAQLSKGGSTQLTSKQMQLHVGLKPSVVDCLDGLKLIADMHRSEYQLKQTVISTLGELALKRSASEDVVSLQRLLVDQPNISKEEVQSLLEIIFAEEIC